MGKEHFRSAAHRYLGERQVLLMQATFFLGSCTPRGFSTFASELAEECGAVDYIKGGSGCGKSTFLRRIADEAAARGLEVWRFLCSSDPQSHHVGDQYDPA